MSDALRIAVLMGGGTSEHEISLLTGRAVVEGLESAGHRVDARVVERGAQLPGAVNASDVVFIALHGGAGEDGRVQAELELLGLPYVGSRPGPCAVAMDKVWTKQIARDADIPVTPEHVLVPGDPVDATLSAAAELGPDLVLKPVDEGSAIGVHLLHGTDELAAQLAGMGERDGRWMLEPFVAGRELTVGFVLEEACPVIEIRPREGFYDYRNKYTAGCTEYDCPADIPDPTAEAVASAALRLYRALQLRDMARIDFRLDPEHGPFLLEANTIPGMTATSLLPMGAAARGMDFPTLCDRLCRTAFERGADES